MVHTVKNRFLPTGPRRDIHAGDVKIRAPIIMTDRTRAPLRTKKRE
jgi:hypothetical protein